MAAQALWTLACSSLLSCRAPRRLPGLQIVSCGARQETRCSEQGTPVLCAKSAASVRWLPLACALAQGAFAYLRRAATSSIHPDGLARPAIRCLFPCSFEQRALSGSRARES